jgi:hypothetical protein
MSDDADEARRSHGTLMDTRADAMATLQSVQMSVPQPLATPITAAIETVRQETQRCLSILGNKYGKQMRDVEWRPPYPSDSRRDPHYHVHL